MKKIILIGFGIFLFLYLFSAIISHNTRPEVKFSSEQQTEMFYRFDEIYHEVTEKEGLDALPEIGQKEWKTPKKDKAIQITADEYNIPTSQVKAILKNVEKIQPSKEELRIFQIYDDRINKAIDTEASGGALIDEDKILQEVANSLGISQQKLKAIWGRVFIWKQN